MTFRKLVLLISTILMLAGVFPVFAQTGFRPANEWGESRFAIDAIEFKSETDGYVDLHVAYKIFYNILSYQKISDGYQGKYEIAIAVEGKDGSQIEGIIREGSIDVDTYHETLRTTDFIINEIKATFPEQDYEVRAILTDVNAQTTREVSIERNKLDFWNKYPTVSRPLFAREIDAATGDSKFNIGNFRVIPSVNRLFGGESDTVLNYYLEAYPGTVNEKYPAIVTNIYNRVKGKVYADTVKITDFSDTWVEIGRVDVKDFVPGEYELEIRMEGRRGRFYDKVVEPFELMLTAETIALTDFETAVKMIKYLATRDEIKKLEAASGKEERLRLWDEFWALRDTDSHSEVNPTKFEYFRRVRHANRNFSVMNKEGWRTDRGMVYITYGEPDEVDDHPFELSSKPYQVWFYYNTNPPRRFLFIDEWGDGNYDLQPPYNGIN